MNPNGKPEKNGQIRTANIAKRECHLVDTAVKNTVQQLVSNKPTLPENNDKWHRVNPDFALAISERKTVTVNCESCGASIVALRPWKRFCNGTCRQRAFQAAKGNDEKNL